MNAQSFSKIFLNTDDDRIQGTGSCIASLGNLNPGFFSFTHSSGDVMQHTDRTLYRLTLLPMT